MAAAILSAGSYSSAYATEPAAGPTAEAADSGRLELPATFRGELPCADCVAIRHHLDLWPDRVFHLGREWVGRDTVRDEVGSWRVDPARSALVLHGGGEAPLLFAIEGRNALRLLDAQGGPIESSLPYALTGDGTLQPTDLSLVLGGEMIYMADAAPRRRVLREDSP